MTQQQTYLIDAPNLVKPEVQLVGLDGNVFSIIGLIASAWQRMGRTDIATELKTRLLHECHSYDGPDGSLALAMQYIDEDGVFGPDEEDSEDEDDYEDEEAESDDESHVRHYMD